MEMRRQIVFSERRSRLYPSDTEANMIQLIRVRVRREPSLKPLSSSPPSNMPIIAIAAETISLVWRILAAVELNTRDKYYQ